MLSLKCTTLFQVLQSRDSPLQSVQLFVADTRFPDTLRPEIFEVRTQSLPAWTLQSVGQAIEDQKLRTGLVLQTFHICISIDYLQEDWVICEASYRLVVT